MESPLSDPHGSPAGLGLPSMPESWVLELLQAGAGGAVSTLAHPSFLTIHLQHSSWGRMRLWQPGRDLPLPGQPTPRDNHAQRQPSPPP